MCVPVSVNLCLFLSVVCKPVCMFPCLCVCSCVYEPVCVCSASAHNAAVIARVFSLGCCSDCDSPSFSTQEALARNSRLTACLNGQKLKGSAGVWRHRGHVVFGEIRRLGKLGSPFTYPAIDVACLSWRYV